MGFFDYCGMRCGRHRREQRTAENLSGCSAGFADFIIFQMALKFFVKTIMGVKHQQFKGFARKDPTYSSIIYTTQRAILAPLCSRSSLKIDRWQRDSYLQ